jgi:hypothetical protein
MNSPIPTRIFLISAGLCALIGAGFLTLLVQANHDGDKSAHAASEMQKPTQEGGKPQNIPASPSRQAQESTHLTESSAGSPQSVESASSPEPSGGMVQIQRIKPVFYQVDESKLASADPSVRADYAALMQQYNDYVAQWNASGSSDLNAWNTRMNDLQSQYNQKIGEALGPQVNPIVENVSVPASIVSAVNFGGNATPGSSSANGGNGETANSYGAGNNSGTGSSAPVQGKGANSPDPGPGLIHFGGSGGLPNNEGLPPQSYHLGG